MLFSIIIPVYNVENYLSKCVGSVLNQSYSDFEIILINDGSTDKSAELCDNFMKKDRRVKSIHQLNSGVSTARNRGLELSSGDYVLFMDSDDYWDNDSVLYDLVTILKEEDNPDWIHNDSYIIERSNGTKYIHETGLNPSIFNSLIGKKALINFLSSTEYFMGSVCKSVFKTSVIKEHKIEFEDGISVGEDADWLYRFILRSKRNILINRPFYCHRFDRPGSAMATKNYYKINSYLSIIEKWFDIAVATNDEYFKNIINQKFSDNFIDYFKYIYPLKSEERLILIKKIERIEILNYVKKPQNIKISNKIYKTGFEKTLRYLYLKYAFKTYLRKIAIKVKIR